MAAPILPKPLVFGAYDHRVEGRNSINLSPIIISANSTHLVEPDPADDTWIMEQRCYDESFLDSCHADIAAVYRIWRSKVRSGNLPSREDIDPSELKDFLPNLMLVDVEQPGPRFRYRLVGTGEVNLRGKDPTGLYLEDAYSGVDGDYCDGNYRYVADNGKHLFDQTPEPTTQGNVTDVEVIFLPLAADGKKVDIVLVFSVIDLEDNERLKTHAGMSDWAKGKSTSDL